MPEYIQPLPAGSYTITQAFGVNPGGLNPAGGHTGIDYAAPIGTPVYAIADGLVEYEGHLAGTYADNEWWLIPDFVGIGAAIDHGDGRPDAIYGHLNQTLVNKGDRVRQGQIIGYVGRTGAATGSHLHFETLPPAYDLNTNTYGRVDPNTYLSGSHYGAAGHTRTITQDVAWIRTEPRADAPLAPGYEEGIAGGAQLAVTGYVQGQDPYDDGVTDDAWYRTRSGFYVWANAAENDLTGLAKLN